MTLHLYLARKYTLTLVAIIGLFGAILVLLGMVDELRNFDIGTITFSDALRLTALKVPADLYLILPLIALLATLSMFLGLARTSELVVTRASGRSALRSVIAPAATAFTYGVIAVAIFNPIVAVTSTKYELLSNRFKDGEVNILSVSDEGLWLRQASPKGQTVIRAARANAEGTQFFDVTFLNFSKDGTPIWRIEATRADLTPQGWDVRDAKRWDLDRDIPNPEAAATVEEHLVVPSDLTRQRIRDSFASPNAVSIWDLRDFIGELDRAGFAALPHRVWFQMELALPLMMVAMVLVGAALTMRHVRFGKTGPVVVLAFTLGLTLFFLRNFAQVMGENGQIPVALAAWSPPAAGILMALGLLLHLEDG
ncbi:Permease, YjgP/YjgQ family [Rhodovulum sp. P5]|uniref:LPS export ABC transporter permease LptG n=1 Tax=Rhodovulum sp. P5 TaxID=1564506 RepID=UPI0009C1EA5C|nr:LPS export ABC transporter permease LptG [Rhodovulum sp. P5]ARE39651.1 Permease, YjgP/YjgQ family [Rhodovulum sp. P5]